MSAPKNKGGRPPGSPNKTTADARRAIAEFVDGNAHRLTEWLDRVAEGVKAQDPETGEEKYVVPPNPAKAFDMFQSVVEYHVPKLARMEVAGDSENPLQVDVHVNVFGELLKNLKMQRQEKE
ncbi:hypothetical protein UFOVP239_9 [uncultured Caudovirales phage]|uniref:Uncharacterized protein n=1 Tax=uncultured Caudovirales phage TaxID=2100421 RepID=A0A6J7WPF0_9CAUD|nr:hypothetical protein UFOVP239_9 [uncultured Caudovirales phage]